MSNTVKTNSSNNSNNSNGSTSTSLSSSLNSSKNDLIIKLVFPPTSSMISKFMFVQENQKVCDVVDYATQLAGLQPGYSLYLPASSNTGRGQWLEDDQLLTNYSIINSGQILIKRKPGLIKRRNTMMALKSFKEGKVQKLSSITKIWSPRYLRLYSQRLVHSSNENDSNTDFIQFADITNVDKEVNRKYTFVIHCCTNSNTPTLNASGNGSNGGLSQSQTNSNFQNISNGSNGGNFADSKKEKEYIFRCINQTEMEEWVSSIRTMLRKSRPDLLLPPLTPSIVNNNNSNSANTSNNNLILPPPSQQTTSSSPTSPTTTWQPTSPTSNNSMSQSVSNENISGISTTVTGSKSEQVSPLQTPTRGRSFSFSLSRPGKKKGELPPYMQPGTPSNNTTSLPPPAPIPLTLSERNIQLEEELKKLTDTLNRDAKVRADLEKKYQKIKSKMASLKKAKERSRSQSTPATPEMSNNRKDQKSSSSERSFISNLLIGSSRIISKDKDKEKDKDSNNNNSNNNGTSVPSTPISSHKRHSSNTQSLSYNYNNNNNNNNNNSNNQYFDECTDNDITSSEMFTNSIYEDLGGDDYHEKDREIKELKEQIVKIKEKLMLEYNEKTKVESNLIKNLEKELYTQKKLDEKRERELTSIEQRQDDHLDAMFEMATRLKKSLYILKDKLEKEQQQQQQQQDQEDEDNNEEKKEFQDDEENEESNVNYDGDDDDDDGELIDGEIGDYIDDDDDEEIDYIHQNLENGSITTSASIKEDTEY